MCAVRQQAGRLPRVGCISVFPSCYAFLLHGGGGGSRVRWICFAALFCHHRWLLSRHHVGRGSAVRSRTLYVEMISLLGAILMFCRRRQLCVERELALQWEAVCWLGSLLKNVVLYCSCCRFVVSASLCGRWPCELGKAFICVVSGTVFLFSLPGHTWGGAVCGVLSLRKQGFSGRELQHYCTFLF